MGKLVRIVDDLFSSSLIYVSEPGWTDVVQQCTLKVGDLHMVVHLWLCRCQAPIRSWSPTNGLTVLFH